MAGIFDLLKTVYGMLGFTYKLKLSTRPDNYIGDLEVWNLAEKVCYTTCQLSLDTTPTK
jgi:threonyl-tRNA synthetase